MARQPFNTRWAQGVETDNSLNSFATPSDVRLATGWEGGQDKDAPPAGHENWWHNRADTALQSLERNGVMTWHPLAVYGLGAPTYASDGNYYESITTNNSGNDPTLTTGFWRYIGSSFFIGYDPGDLKMVAHNNVPAAGWLKCNGAVLLRASYPRLFAVIGTAHNSGGETSLQFRLPDYRGEFVRGFDDGRGVDSGRVFGSAQSDMLRSHSHEIAANGYLVNLGTGQAVLTTTGSQAATLPAGGAETRPRNKVANYWIRY
ncbi:phage tail protein [Pseudomonas sp. SMN5]|uniref:phage tail protein n=1 Tax=Pseudomonas sp. SMN5 TaxID=3390198 RepID=UPI003F8274D8